MCAKHVRHLDKSDDKTKQVMYGERCLLKNPLKIGSTGQMPSGPLSSFAQADFVNVFVTILKRKTDR